MKKVIVFFNAEPAVVVTVMKGITTIMREFPNRLTALMQGGEIYHMLRKSQQLIVQKILKKRMSLKMGKMWNQTFVSKKERTSFLYMW